VLVATTFLIVIAAFGATDSWEVILAVPAAVLTGLAFATPIAAFAATQENETYFNAIFRFMVIPMFLFSGTFFPVSQLPAALRPLAYFTPLWHGVDLCRTLALGTATVGRSLLHIGYLTAWVVAGVAAGVSAFRRRLVS
jgi:lipooligosaccharide transport system permease protein